MSELDLHAFLKALDATPLGAAVRGATPGWDWLFPIVEIVHVIALTLVFGSILMLDLRLAGISSRESSVSRLSRELLPLTWGAFVVAAISGTILFTSKPIGYYGDIRFKMKFVLMFLAGVNMLVFHKGIYRRVAQWDAALPPPAAARVAGALSLLLWTGIVFLGRYVGFYA
jgi:hypothetical protein